MWDELFGGMWQRVLEEVRSEGIAVVGVKESRLQSMFCERLQEWKGEEKKRGGERVPVV